MILTEVQFVVLQARVEELPGFMDVGFAVKLFIEQLGGGTLFTEKLATKFPCVVLNNWDDLDTDALLNNYIKPDISGKLTMNIIKTCIAENIKFF